MEIAIYAFLFVFISGLTVTTFELDDLIFDAWKRRKALKRPNLINQLQKNARRIRKIEQFNAQGFALHHAVLLTAGDYYCVHDQIPL